MILYLIIVLALVTSEILRLVMMWALLQYKKRQVNKEFDKLQEVLTKALDEMGMDADDLKTKQSSDQLH